MWALKPDKLDDNKNLRGTDVFIVEMGDKTQLATIALTASYDS
jgi:putative Ca2+/H+ antiporter (TMEM165/GDT1 family)